MLWLLSTLLASSILRNRAAIGLSIARHHVRTTVRCRPPFLFGEGGKPELAIEEYRALAGVWRGDLELDDGDVSVALHLAAPTSTIAFGGKVFLMQDNLPFNICHGESGWTSARWSVERKVCAGAEGDDQLRMYIQLGNLYLEGRGQRRGLRCSAFSGTVFEGGTDPVVVGRFSLQLALPLNSNMSALEERYARRIASRRAPPPSYQRFAFFGSWRLLLSMDDDDPPPPLDVGGVASSSTPRTPRTHAIFPVELCADGSWHSVGAAQTLAGTWGMSDAGGDASPTQPSGTGLWLKAHRERSTETLRGIAGLPVRSDFVLSGQPIRATIEHELAAHAPSLAGDGCSAAASTTDGVDGHGASTVDGQLWMGAVERAYFGRFSLLRGRGVEVMDVGVAPPPSIASPPDLSAREEAAKRAWFAKLEAPSWGKGAATAVATTPSTISPTVAPSVSTRVEELLGTKAETAGAVATTRPSTEEAAKRAWLAKLDTPAWGPHAAAMANLTPSADSFAEARSLVAKAVATGRSVSGDHVAPIELSREEAAKRAWLAKLEAPSWGR